MSNLFSHQFRRGHEFDRFHVPLYLLGLLPFLQIEVPLYIPILYLLLIPDTINFNAASDGVLDPSFAIECVEIATVLKLF